MLAHMGVSTSLPTIHNMHDALEKQASRRLKTLPWTNSAFDNFDMDFKTAEPTMQHQGFHWSATSATFTELQLATNYDLQFVKYLHERSNYNKDKLSWRFSALIKSSIVLFTTTSCGFSPTGFFRLIEGLLEVLTRFFVPL